MVRAIGAVILGEAVELSEVCAEMILANGKVGISVMMELFRAVLDAWQTGVLVLRFKEKGDMRNRNA